MRRADSSPIGPVSPTFFSPSGRIQNYASRWFFSPSRITWRLLFPHMLVRLRIDRDFSLWSGPVQVGHFPFPQ